MQDKTAIGFSDTFREYIESLVEEVVINGEPFNAQKKWLRRRSEAEGVDYESLECNLNDFIEIIKEWHELHTKSSEMMARMLAKECHLSETALQTLFNRVPQRVGTGANGHEYVDLGLPSGTLWATCNIGATKPEEYGDYFAWGETEPKDYYDWSTYRYCNGNEKKLTKYCDNSSFGYNGFTDNLTTLQSGDDPATSWGSSWRTPSEEQWDELLKNTTNKWMTQNEVEGMLFTAKNGKTLFLPAAGGCWDIDLDDTGIRGYYWSRSLLTDYPSFAWLLDLTPVNMGMIYYDRGNGFSVRPVRQN